MTAEKSMMGWGWPGIRPANRGWSVAIGVILIALGVFAIAEPFVAGLAVTVFVGWLLLFGGAAHLIASFRGGGAGRVVWQVLLAIVYVIGGLYFLTHPLLGLKSLTLLLAVIFFVEAVFRLVTYFQSRGEMHSGWWLVNGLVTLLLGFMIWAQWPSSSVWAIGLLLGVNLLMAGFARLMIGASGHRIPA